MDIEKGSVVLIAVFAVVAIICLTAIVALGGVISTKTAVNHDVNVESPTMTVEPVTVNVAGDEPSTMGAPMVMPIETSQNLGGLVSISTRSFPQGIKVGSTDQFSIDSSGNMVNTGSLDVGRLKQGGSVLSITASTTLTAAQIDTNSVITVAASTTAHEDVITLTLPATSTLYDYLSINGDSMTLLIVNATSTSGASTTFAEGTGIEIKHATTSGIVVYPQEISRLTFTRLNDGTTTVEVVNNVDSD